MVMPSATEGSGLGRHLALAVSQGTGTASADTGGGERYLPSLPDAGGSSATGAGKPAAMERQRCTGSEMGESADTEPAPPVTPVHPYCGTPGRTDRITGYNKLPTGRVPVCILD